MLRQYEETIEEKKARLEELSKKRAEQVQSRQTDKRAMSAVRLHEKD